MYIKMLAASEKKTISEYLLSFPRARMPKSKPSKILKSKCNFPGCDQIHRPNEETEKTLRNTEAGINLEEHDSLEEFWEAMGIQPDAKD